MLWLTTSDVSERQGKQTNHSGKAWDLQVGLEMRGGYFVCDEG